MGKLSKNVVIYFIGNTISRFMGIVVLLVATHILTNKEDIGYFTFITNTTTMLLTIFCLQIWMSIIRYIFDYNTIKGKLKIISTGYFIGFLGFLLYIILLLIYCIIKKYSIMFFLQMLFISFSYTFNQLVQFACRGLGKNRLYAISGVVGSFAQLLTSVIFLCIFKITSSALILATAFSYLSQGVFIELFLKSLRKFRLKYIDIPTIKKLISYSIPTTMNSVAYCFNQSSYTWFFKFYYGTDAIGAFTPAYRVISLIGLFVMSFNFAFQEYSFLMNKSSLKTKIYNKTFNSFFRFISSGTIILMPITCIFFSFMVGSSYKDSMNLMPMLYLSSVFDAVQIFLGSIMQAEKKVNYMFFSQLVGVIVTTVVMFFSHSLIGLQSAGLSISLCFFVICLIRFSCLSNILKLKFKKTYMLHFVPTYILTTIIFLRYGVIANFLYGILTFFYFIICNKDLIIKFILRFNKKYKKA